MRAWRTVATWSTLTPSRIIPGTHLSPDLLRDVLCHRADLSLLFPFEHHARKHLASKRGAGERPVQFDEACVTTDPPRELVALGDALEDLMQLDERKARVTALRYFGGLTHDEIAAACGIHVNTVSRDLHLSEAWLRGRVAA